jgi:hypothetical protein
MSYHPAMGKQSLLGVLIMIVVASQARVARAGDPTPPGETLDAVIEVCSKEPNSDTCQRWMAYCSIVPGAPVCASLGATANANMQEAWNSLEQIDEDGVERLQLACFSYAHSGLIENQTDELCSRFKSWCGIHFTPSLTVTRICDGLGYDRVTPDVYQVGSASASESSPNPTGLGDNTAVSTGVSSDSGPAEDPAVVAAREAERKRWLAVDGQRRVLRFWLGPSHTHVAGQAFSNAGEFNLQLAPLIVSDAVGVEAAAKAGDIGHDPANDNTFGVTPPAHNRLEVSGGVALVVPGQVHVVTSAGAGMDKLVDRNPAGFVYGKVAGGYWFERRVRADAFATYFARSGNDELRLGLWATVYRFAIGVEHSLVFSDVDATTIGFGVDIF